MNPTADLDPLAIRRQFARRAARLHEADFLLREVERRMIDRLDVVRLDPQRIVDVGCGLGRGLFGLRQRYPLAEAIGIDVAAPVVLAARRANRAPGGGFLARLARRPGPGVHWLAADAAALPLSPLSVGLLWSNLMLHWAPDPRAVLREWHRALRPEALLMFSLFGVDTLRELSSGGTRLMRFHDMHDIGDWLIEAGFAEPVMDMERIEVRFSSAQRLLADIHALGGNALAGRVRGLRGRAMRDQWLADLSRRAAPDGSIAVGFEIVYGHAWRGQRKTRADGLAPVEFMPRAPH